MGLNRFVRSIGSFIGHTFALLFMVAFALGIGYFASVVVFGVFGAFLIVVGFNLAGLALPDDPDFYPPTHFIDAVTSISLKAGVVVGLGLACAGVGDYFKGLTGKENFITRFVTNLVRYIKRPEVWAPPFLVVMWGLFCMLCSWIVCAIIEIPSLVFFGRPISNHVDVLVVRITVVVVTLIGLGYGLKDVLERILERTKPIAAGFGALFTSLVRCVSHPAVRYPLIGLASGVLGGLVNGTIICTVIWVFSNTSYRTPLDHHIAFSVLSISTIVSFLIGLYGAWKNELEHLPESTQPDRT